MSKNDMELSDWEQEFLGLWRSSSKEERASIKALLLQFIKANANKGGALNPEGENAGFDNGAK